VIDNRRLIGRRFDDPIVKKDAESWPFKVVDDAGNPMVQVEYLNETKSFSAQEISSMVLMKVCVCPHFYSIAELSRFN
jgi:heat shock protein 1/8